MCHLIDHGADLAVPDLTTHFVFVNLTAGTLFAPMRPETVYAKVDSVTNLAGPPTPEPAVVTKMRQAIGQATRARRTLPIAWRAAVMQAVRVSHSWAW